MRGWRRNGASRVSMVSSLNAAPGDVPQAARTEGKVTRRRVTVACKTTDVSIRHNRAMRPLAWLVSRVPVARDRWLRTRAGAAAGDRAGRWPCRMAWHGALRGLRRDRYPARARTRRRGSRLHAGRDLCRRHRRPALRRPWAMAAGSGAAAIARRVPAAGAPTRCGPMVACSRAIRTVARCRCKMTRYCRRSHPDACEDRHAGRCWKNDGELPEMPQDWRPACWSQARSSRRTMRLHGIRAAATPGSTASWPTSTSMAAATVAPSSTRSCATTPRRGNSSANW